MRHQKLFRICCQLLGWLLVVLAISGLYLTFYYQPSAAESWRGISDSSRTMPDVVRLLHRSAAFGFVAMSFLVVVLGLSRREDGHEISVLRRVIIAPLPVLAGASMITGFMLPWHQLALWAVRVGTDMKGYGAVLDGQTKYVLGSSGVSSPGDVIRTLALHLGSGILIALWIAVHLRRRPWGQPRKSITVESNL